MIPVPLFDLKFLMRIRGARAGTSKSAALEIERKQTVARLSNWK
jgi:hypothetical protein